MKELNTSEIKSVNGGIAFIPAAIYAARGAVALYGLFEAGRYAATVAYSKN
ncbi:class IIb bacteriocin, lactobin A/cerein 7B family [Thalassomonas viridans]|uniref:Class IIb bacteriocin, lactobin A/cerein 7B family n=1 Tax=Thalassomonas viridans TaxID=137584 RepID=A0AAE9Z294_9GAMM|nr:class IIb bacteriocin, lactobin A/cerein 7B family [Thalassomonas viridans]WDE03887.1 class IIb bacteriocin, lactobin A/cerein 7B family [Thalassomonas viridans]